MNKLLIAAGVAGTAIAFDQATKQLVRGTPEGGHVYQNSWVDIDHMENRGIIMGGHENLTGLFQGLSLVAAPALGYLIYKVGGKSPMAAVAGGLMAGAVLCNPLEGIVRNKVTDMVNIHGGPGWFNAADAMIAISIPIAIATAIRGRGAHL